MISSHDMDKDIDVFNTEPVKYFKDFFSLNYEQSFNKCKKISENLLIIYNDDYEYKVFDFENLKIIDLKFSKEQISSKVFYYINNKYYILDDTLYILSNNTLNEFIPYNNINDKSFNNITLKYMNKFAEIPKDILISRSEFFKDMFDVYDLSLNNFLNEFINEYFEDIDIYLEYITKGNIIDINKLFKICLYLQDKDIEYLTYYMSNNFNKEKIFEYISILDNYPKQKNILIENYLNIISRDEYNKFIKQCDNNLLKLIAVKQYKEYI